MLSRSFGLMVSLIFLSLSSDILLVDMFDLLVYHSGVTKKVC